MSKKDSVEAWIKIHTYLSFMMVDTNGRRGVQVEVRIDGWVYNMQVDNMTQII